MQKKGKKRGFVNSVLSKIKKRGLSTIVVTLIIILISLVAVGIIWVVVRNVIQTGTEQVALGQFTLDAKIKDVGTDNSSNNVTLTVRRNAGAGEFSKINFVFSDGKDSEVITEAVSLNQLEERRFILHLIKLNVSKLISISIVPILNQNGKDIIGNVLDKYTIGSGQSSIIIPTGCTPSLSCAALNYECGLNWANGSCGTSFNCEPPNCTSRYGAGYSCNSSGRCVFGTCAPLISNYCSTQGYVCGYWGNNTCSGNLSCGSCTNGNCNTSGRCACNSGWGNCNNDNTCECNLSISYCGGGSCVLNPTGNTIYALSCSYADVSSAIGNATNGDTVRVPAGSCTWSSTLTITKGITLRGSGVDKTNITGTGTTDIFNVDLSSNLFFRLVNFSLIYTTNNLGGSAIYINGRGNSWATIVRIDHNKFVKGTRPVYASGWVEGVVDHNTFINNNIAFHMTGDNDDAWSRPIEAGTEHALFAENNLFIIDNNADREPNHLIYHQEGGRTVVRYNIFNGSAYTNGNSIFHDSHGNQNYYQGTSGDFRGQPIIEIYNNVFQGHHSYGFGSFRGGSVLYYNNVLTTDSGSAPYLSLTEEEDWQTAFFSPLKTVWNAEDQVMNSFFWNNTANGVGITSIWLSHGNSDCTGSSSPYACCTGSGTGTCDDVFIQKDRDYFMHAPNATGGRTYYTGRPGGAEAWVSGANAYYPYTPYTYPHPLTLI